jgi:hypothetical protein
VINVSHCLVHSGAVRVRVSQGDGGIDVMVPVDGGFFDIYQIKYFSTALDDSRTAQIRGSLRRIGENSSVTVRN